MQDQPTPRSVAEEFDYAERIVLDILLEPDFHGIWTVQEVARAFGDEVRAADAIAGLRRAGLVHRCDDFVFATRPAARCAQLQNTY
jgi:hypothetical protein